MSELEQRYRRLLALYPRDHREQHGEEMLDVLMAAGGDRGHPGWKDTADLLWGAFRLHLRRVVGADGGIDPRGVLAIVSLLGPIAGTRRWIRARACCTSTRPPAVMLLNALLAGGLDAAVTCDRARFGLAENVARAMQSWPAWRH